MITERRIEIPQLGIRYTHDVLWRGTEVGYATEVGSLQNDPKLKWMAGYMTWMAFVCFHRCQETVIALATDEVELTNFSFDPMLGYFKASADKTCLLAQRVILRGTNLGGHFSLILRENSLPIQGLSQQVTEADLQIRSRRAPHVKAW